jgi:glyoxylase-like metal-dependent hydrolase (beta-lactamase superfamily II)
MQFKNHVSRRTLLKGFGAGALALAGGGLPALAQEATDAQALAYYRFNLGTFDMAVISDATLGLPPTVFGPNAEEGEVAAFIEQYKLANAEGNITGIVQILVARTGSDILIFDTGLGLGNPNGSRLIPTLAALGIQPGDVTKVAVSHLHGDHVNGLTGPDNAPLFPNAQVYFPQPEYDFMQGTAADSPAAGMVSGATAKLQYALDGGQIVFYNDDEEIAAGIRAMAAHGHTPGHMAFHIESEGQRLVNLVDAAVQSQVALRHPEWYVAFDSMPDMAVETRTALFTLSSDEGVRLFGYHFPFPGLGYAVREGDAFVWVPSAF